VRLEEDEIGRVARVRKIVKQPTRPVVNYVREASGRPSALLDVQEERRRVQHVHVVVAAQRVQNHRQEHVCFWVFWDEQIICKPPWGSVGAAVFQKGRQNNLFAGIDASPLVKRDTQHTTYTLHSSRNRERRRSIYGSSSRRNVRSKERFLFSQTQICKDLAWDGL